MKTLISVASAREAETIIDAGVDVLDITNAAEGPLGAAPPAEIIRLVELARPAGIPVSACIGDLPFKPGTAALAARGATTCGVDLLRAGLHGMDEYRATFDLLVAIRRAARSVSEEVKIIAVGYADHRRFASVDPSTLLRAAADAGCDGVMLDTAIKPGRCILDEISMADLRHFLRDARRLGLETALAGSLGIEHLDHLLLLAPDAIGLRAAVCEGGDRTAALSHCALEAFLEALRGA